MNFKKILALVLVVAMCLSMVPTYAFADDVELWDESDAAVQNDAPLEDEYIDEDPVTQEPAEEEPEATDPAEPAAEEPAPAEPAAEESAPAEASADTSNALTAEELNAYEAIGDKAMIGSKTYATFAAAVDAAVAGDTITMLADDTLAAPVTLDKDLTIQSGTAVATLTGTILITGGNVTLTNVNTTSVTVTGGKLSIPENDLGTNTSIIASAGITGDVKGGKFDEISGSLFAENYAPKDYDGTTLLSGTVQAKDGLAKYTWVATRVDANGTYYYTNDTFANAFGERVDPENKVPGTVTLLGNVTLKNAVAVQTEVTLDLNGHTITNGTAFNAGTTTAEASLLYTAGVSGHGTAKLTIKDSDTAGTGAITATGTTVKQAVNLGLGSLTIQSGKISGPNAIYMNAGTLSITGGTLTATAETGAAVYLYNNSGDLSAAITISNGTLSGPRAVFEEASRNGDSITVTGGIFKTTDTTANKNTVELKSVDTDKNLIKPSFSGGTYDTRVSEKYLKDGYICAKNTDGTWTIQPGSYDVKVVTSGTTTGQGYLKENIADAIKAASDGYEATTGLTLYIVKGDLTGVIPVGSKLKVFAASGASFTPTVAETVVMKLNAREGTIGKDNKITNANKTTVVEAVASVAAVTVDGVTTYYDNYDAAWTTAKNKTNATLKLTAAEPAGYYINLDTDGSFITVDETGEFKPTVKVGAQMVRVVEGEGTVTYTAEAAVASYQDADDKEVYTTTFNEAVTEAVKLAGEATNYEVKLYAVPTITETTKDFYAMKAAGTLHVVATGTDLANVKEKLELNNFYKKMVTNDGDFKVTALHQGNENAFTYTATAAVAKARLNTEVESYEYFDDVNEAVKFVVEEHYNDHLYLIPLDNVTFTVTQNQIKGVGTLNKVKYLGRTIRIDNSGEKKIKLADVGFPETKPTAFYTYSTAEGEGFTAYTLKPAVVRIPATPGMDEYFDPMPGTDTKLFASFAEAVEADSTAVIELIATPTDPTTETYVLGIPGGPSTLKVRLNDFEWLTVNPYGQAALDVKPDTTDTSVTVYSLAEPVASITTGTGASAETKYYNDFAEAVDVAYTYSLETCLTITLLKTIEEPYTLADGRCFKVIKGAYDVTVTTAAPKAVLAVTDEKGVTSYSVDDAVASIDFGEEVGIKYYATFAEAATAAAEKETITLYKSASYELGAKDNVSKLIVITNGNKLTVEPGVTGQAVKETRAKVDNVVVTTYELSAPVASITTSAGTKYYSTFAEAAKDGRRDNDATDVPVIVLLDNITDKYALAQGKQINVQYGNYDVVVEPAANLGGNPNVLYVTEGTVTNIKCVGAVASIQFNSEPKPTYYATWEEAFKEAFVSADTAIEDALTVNILAPAYFEDDIFEPTTLGYVLVNTKIDVVPNISVKGSVKVLPKDVEGVADLYKVNIIEAVASRGSNSGKVDYFPTITEAVEGGSNEKFPIVLLADNLSTTLAKGATLYINKNGHEFTVTKVDPELNWKDGTDVQYSILEEQSGDVTVYSTGLGVAFIDFTESVPSGEHDMVDKHNYVFYNSFADAVEAAAGAKTIVINAANAGLPAGTSYTVKANETLIVDKQFADVSVVAPEGFVLNDEVEGTVHTYTVTETVALVTVGTKVTPYADLTEAVKDAVKAYTGDNTAFLTLAKDAGEDFTATFGMLDKMMVIKNGFTLDPAKISAPEGYFVVATPIEIGNDPYLEYSVVKGIASVVAVENGKEVTYVYDNLIAAINKVKEIENAKAYNDPTKDVLNPDTVINLWADNPVAFTFSAPGGTGVQSLMIANNGFKPNLVAAADTANKKYFVEEIGTDALGVTQYKNSQIIASVDYSPVWAEPGSEDEKIVNYSSFAAAANDAMRDRKVVKIIAVYADFANDDVFEMRIGSLQVDRNYMITPDQLAGFIADKRIVPVGENVALSCTWDDPDVKKAKVATFVVEGSEAMIVYPGEATPRFFKTFLEAMKVQNGNANLPITPLTDIEYIYTEAELGALRTFILAENVNYPVSVKLDKYETVADKTVTGKFDFKPGVCYIVSDVPVGYDATYATIYRNDYYATITSAVDDAQNTKTIVLMQNNSYEIQDADEVVIAQIGDANHQDVNSFIVTTNIEGSGVSYTHTDPVSGVHKGVYTYTVVATQSIVVNPGEGGSFSDGSTDPKTLAIDVPDATIPATAYATANLPVRTGYTVDYYDGNDGKKYAATADTVKGIFAFPDKMPENGLELTPHWTAQDVNVFFYDNGNQIKALATTVKYGELIPEPTYTVTGYHVVGWYRDAAFEHSFIFAATPVTSDLMDKKGNVKLYAKMAKDEFTVHFTSLADNVPDDSVNDLTVEYGATIAGPKVTDWTRAGYKDGKVTAWMYTAPGATEPTAWVWSNGVTSNLTLVADWEPETVTIVWADGSEVIHTDKKVNVDSELTSPDVSKRTKPNARIDTVNTWVDQDGVYYNGKVPYHTVDPWIFQINWIDQVDVSFIYNDELIKTISVDMNSTLADNEDVPKPEDETKAYAWTLKGEDYDVTTPVTATLTLVGTLVEVEPEPDYSGYATVASSLSLEDNINMNAYVTIKEGTDPADYGVTVTFNGETTVDGTLADLATYYRGEYKLSDIAIVAAPQMNDPADVTITYKGVEATTATLTVRGYAEEHIEDERFEEVKDLLVALLDFGAYSQLQFNYDTDNLANAKYSSGMVPTTDIPEFQMTTAGKVTGITGASPALTLVSDTTLNMYFAAPKKGDFQFKVDGETAKATYARKEYKASLPKIAVAELGDEHDFTVTSGNETMTVTLAPLAYAFQHQNDEGTLGNVCKAVYLYYLAAVEYFG